jgi:hypothetical protein
MIGEHSHQRWHTLFLSVIKKIISLSLSIYLSLSLYLSIYLPAHNEETEETITVTDNSKNNLSVQQNHTMMKCHVWNFF